MRTYEIGFHIFNVLLKEQKLYPVRMFVDLAAMIARCGVLLVLYHYVFIIRGGEINNLTYQVAAWSIFLYFSFSSLKIRELSKQIMLDVQTGNVEILFSKPISYIGFRSFWQLCYGLLPFIVINLFGVTLMILFIGLPESMQSSFYFFTLLLTFILAIALSIAMYLIVGLLSFWMEDITPVFWMVDKTVMVLGGSYLPVALFPDLMYKIAIFSPFGASKFMTHSVYESWSSMWFQLLFIQFFWVVLLWACAFGIFKLAKIKVSINGG